MGLTYRPFKNLTLFGSYSEGFRAPTPAELTCADPNDPCNLPNAFLADPPLDPVVARTYEFGARGKLPFGQGINWSLAFFRTDLQDDILFVVTQSTSGGFFQNVDQTRRQGVEAGVSGDGSACSIFSTTPTSMRRIRPTRRWPASPSPPGCKSARVTTSPASLSTTSKSGPSSRSSTISGSGRT